MSAQRARRVRQGRAGLIRSIRTIGIALALGFMLMAPAAAWAQSLEEAARQAARQYNAKVLSARTIQQGNRRVHEIRLLTEEGVVKTVRIPDRRSQRPGRGPDA